MTKAAFAPHRLNRNQIRPLGNTVIVSDMSFDGRTLNSGIVLLSDDGKGYGIRPRWGRVYAVGPEQTEVTVGQWVMVAHGRWTRGIDVLDESGELTLRKIDPNDILLVTDSDQVPQDDTQSDAVHVDKLS
jgi:co-chaperonin GroES (HSP10)